MQQLRARARTAYSRIPLDIRGIPELRQLVGKISIFALTQIKQQIVFAKKENLMGNILKPPGRCHCRAFMQYQLPCIHMIPIDGSPIPFESISRFWHLSNWDNSLQLDLNSLTIRYRYRK